VKKISSSATMFHKKLFPIFWFGFLTFFVVLMLRGPVARGEWILLLGPLAMGVFGFVIMKKLVWILVDEVHDGGDHLLVRNGSEQERVPLSNIMNVSASIHAKPPRVTLRLVKPGKFGPEITFSPKFPLTLNPFAKNPIVEDLIVRVDKARRA
jgi:hypothetical protein